MFEEFATLMTMLPPDTPVFGQTENERNYEIDSIVIEQTKNDDIIILNE